MMNGAPTVRRPTSRATSKKTSWPWCHMSSSVVVPPFSRSHHAERGDRAQLLGGELLRRERGERQQDVVDELRDERLHLEVVRDAAEQAAADAVRVQVDEARHDQAVLVADDLLAGGGRVARDGLDPRAVDVDVVILQQDLRAVPLAEDVLAADDPRGHSGMSRPLWSRAARLRSAPSRARRSHRATAG